MYYILIKTIARIALPFVKWAKLFRELRQNRKNFNCRMPLLLLLLSTHPLHLHTDTHTHFALLCTLISALPCVLGDVNVSIVLVNKTNLP